MLRTTLRILLVGAPAFLAGVAGAWYFSAAGVPEGHLTRGQVARLFGDYGLQQYDKIVAYNRRSEGILRVGDRAPDVELHRVEGGTARISDFFRDRPLVITFGSYT